MANRDRDDAARPGRGRPPKPEPTTPVNVRLSSSTYDAAYTRSRCGGVSVPTVVRRALARYLDDDDDD
jgi:hypothetical protein